MNEANKCPQCGTSVETGAKFCNHCGTPLRTAEAQPTPSADSSQSVKTKSVPAFDVKQLIHALRYKPKQRLFVIIAVCIGILWILVDGSKGWRDAPSPNVESRQSASRSSVSGEPDYSNTGEAGIVVSGRDFSSSEKVKAFFEGVLKRTFPNASLRSVQVSGLCLGQFVYGTEVFDGYIALTVVQPSYEEMARGETIENQDYIAAKDGRIFTRLHDGKLFLVD